MLSLLFLLATRQSNLDSDLQRAVADQKLGSPEFKKSVSRALAKHGIDENGKFEHQRTLGNPNGLLLTAHSYAADAHSSPIWWRIFVWSDGLKNHAQILKEAKLFNEDGSFTEGEGYWRDDRLVIVGSQVTGGNGERAALTEYRLANAQWRESQFLEDKREGGAFFARNHKAVDPTRIRVLTREFTTYLHQPHVGPLLRYESAWRLIRGTYVQGPTHRVDTPLAELDTLAGLAVKNDRRAFNRRVPSTSQSRLWDALKKYMAVQTISNEVRDETEVFQFGDTGPIVQFAKKSGRWTPIHWWMNGGDK